MVNVGIIGVGYWGVNLLRNFYELDGSNVAMVCDSNVTRLNKVLSDKKYIGIKGTTNPKDIYNDKSIDVVVVATPTHSHYENVKDALNANKHVFCEKPLTYNPKPALDLIDTAKRRGLELMVGHIFLYNNAVKYIKDNIKDIKYMHAQRNGLGPIRQDCNAMWDLTPHYISLFNYLTDSKPESVFANGKIYIQKDKGIEDAVSMSLDYPNNVMANVNASWIDPVKTRKLTVVGSDKMIVFDDMALDKISVFNKGVDYQPKSDNYGEFQLSIRDGDIIQPKIDRKSVV